MNLNIYNEPLTKRSHFSMIKTIHNITKVYKCSICESFYSEYKKLKNHKCGKTEVVFADGDYSPQKSIFDELETTGIKVPEVY